MRERYYGTLNEHGWTNRVESKDFGISMRFIREWKAEEDQHVTALDVEALRMALDRRDRRALPPDGPSIGPDVPGGGAI